LEALMRRTIMETWVVIGV